MLGQALHCCKLAAPECSNLILDHQGRPLLGCLCRHFQTCSDCCCFALDNIDITISPSCCSKWVRFGLQEMAAIADGTLASFQPWQNKLQQHQKSEGTGSCPSAQMQVALGGSTGTAAVVELLQTAFASHAHKVPCNSTCMSKLVLSRASTWCLDWSNQHFL